MAKKEMPLVEVAREFENVIAEMFDTYEKELTINVDKTIEKVANEFKDDLYKVTPVSNRKSNHLRDHLNVRKVKKSNHTACEVNFGKKGWLSTILEFGATYSNGKTYKHPFVRPLFERKKENYFKQIKEAVERGGDNE